MHGNLKLEDSVFNPLSREVFVEIVRKIVDPGDTSVQFYSAFADDFVASLTQLRTICHSTAEIRYLSSMTKIATWAVTDPVESKTNHLLRVDLILT